MNALPVKRAAMFVLAIITCIAVWKIIPNDNPTSLMNWAKDKVAQVEENIKPLANKAKENVKNLPKGQKNGLLEAEQPKQNKPANPKTKTAEENTR